jgi:hypothetical protein
LAKVLLTPKGDERMEIDAITRHHVLCDDITDVAVWLRDMHPGEKHALMIDYYHHQKTRKEIAYVVVLGPAQEKRRAIRADATRAFEALGWRIIPTHGDVIDLSPYPIQDLSAHEKLRMIARVRNALDH